MNFLSGGLPLGRWFGVRVLLHWTFLLYAAFRLYSSRGDVAANAAFLGILFGIVLLHEFGHAMACRSVGGRAEHIVLWPLGGLAFVEPPPRPWPALWTTVGGPLVNVALIPVFWGLAHFAVLPANDLGVFLGHLIQAGYIINIFLLVFNLLPFYPMDGGRILQEILWMAVGYRLSLQIAGMVGTIGGIGFIVLGLGLWHIKLNVPVDYVPGQGIMWWPFNLGGPDPNTMLAVIGLLAAMESYAIYRRSQDVTAWRKN